MSQTLEKSILKQLREQDPERAAKAEHLFTLPVLRKSGGFVIPAELVTRLRRLPDLQADEFEDEVAGLGLKILEAVVIHDEKICSPPPESMVHPQPVFDYLQQSNPFFQRWLEFRSLRPSPHPETWEEFAVRGLPEKDHDYAREMRDLGQLLLDLIRRRKLISRHLATCLANSHKLEEPDRYLNTASWVLLAVEDAMK